MLYRVLYDIRYIKIILNIMKMVFEKKFGKSRVRYIVSSLYRGLTVSYFQKYLLNAFKNLKIFTCIFDDFHMKISERVNFSKMRSAHVFLNQVK